MSVGAIGGCGSSYSPQAVSQTQESDAIEELAVDLVEQMMNQSDENQGKQGNSMLQSPSPQGVGEIIDVTV